MATHVSSDEAQAADALISSARKKGVVKVEEPPRDAGKGKGSGTAAANCTCRSCEQKVLQVCDLNGCCARCVFEVDHFQKLGQKTISKGDEVELGQAGGPRAATYGELTPLGFRQLVARLSLTSEDVFVDCGSGTGRLVLLAAKECGVRRAIGVELSSSRHSIALELLAAANLATSTPGKATRTSTRKGKHKASLDTAAAAAEPGPQAGLAPPPPPVLFVCADCAAPRLWIEDGPLVGATVVFTCSILFDEQLMSRLAQRIESCPTVRVVATLQRFPAGHAPRGFAEAAPAEMCETSWMVAKHACPLLSGTGPCTAGARDGHEIIKGGSGTGSAVYVYLRTATSGSARSGSARSGGATSGSAAVLLEDLHAAGLALMRTTDGATQWQFGT